MKVSRTALSFALMAGSAHAGGAYSNIIAFSSKTGANSSAGLIADANGALYGVTFIQGPRGYGTVFKLTPPAPGQNRWSLQTIYAFGKNGGVFPSGNLLLGNDGALYGTTSDGDFAHLFGTVFRLVPPPPIPGDDTGAWTLETLWTFTGRQDGGVSTSGLIMDSQGALYGTTSIGGKDFQGDGFGTVFKITKPAAPSSLGKPWNLQTLCYFGHARRSGAFPNAPLLLGQNGVLYGTDAAGGVTGNGTVFTVTPPGPGETDWTKTDVWEFKLPDSEPVAGLVPGPDGALYGTTTGYAAGVPGTIFRVFPPVDSASKWREEVLFNFNGLDGYWPVGNLTPDGHGGFYGAAYMGGKLGGGTLFHVSQPQEKGAQWPVETIHSFNINTVPNAGFDPNGGLLRDKSGVLYGTTFLGGKNQEGVVFRFTP